MPLPTPEQEARAKWDLLLTDLEHRQAQHRRIYQEMEATRQDIYWKPWQVLAAMLTGAGAFFAAGAAVMALLLQWHP